MLRMKYNLILLLFIAMCPMDVSAQNSPPKPIVQFKKSQNLGLPLNCELEKTCWVMNYVDFDQNDSIYTDPNCLQRTYDTHKGTDFALLDEKSMNDGVPVLSVKDGTILRIRDGEPDNWKTKADLDKIKTDRKECGNAILITHDDDTQSVYCHLRQNSIIVKKDQRIKKGDTIAMVGMSGLTEFPHLHYGYLKNKKIIDPFTGRSIETQCGLKDAKSLWDKGLGLNYAPLNIQSAGFSTQVPTLDNLGKDAQGSTELTFKDDKIIFWTILLGVRLNDEVSIEIIDANNNPIVTEKITQDKNRARQLYYIGKKLDKTKLPEGAYTGIVKIKRAQEGVPPIEQSKFSTSLVTKSLPMTP